MKKLPKLPEIKMELIEVHPDVHPLTQKWTVETLPDCVVEYEPKTLQQLAAARLGRAIFDEIQKAH